MGCYAFYKSGVVSWDTNSKVAHYMTTIERGYGVKGHKTNTLTPITLLEI
jgi:hypothetical protein